MFEKAKLICLEGKQADINIQALFDDCLKNDGTFVIGGFQNAGKRNEVF